MIVFGSSSLASPKRKKPQGFAALIDGDIIAYRIASASEVVIHWDEDLTTLHAHLEPAKASVDAELARLAEECGATRVVVAVSDKTNYRKSIYPDYKATRTKVRKPILLAALREYLIQEHDGYLRPGLEADDILGILATHKTLIPEERRVLVSIDKDFRTIPCLLWNNKRPFAEATVVTQAEADRWHLVQTLTGDATDNYPGCPGIGAVKAERIVEQAMASDDPWAVVVEAFVKAGLTADDALLQARLARILRADEYDFDRKAPILWTPDKLNKKN